MDRSNLFIGAGVLVGLGTLAYWFLNSEEGGVADSGRGGTATQSAAQATQSAAQTSSQRDYRTEMQKARDEYILANTQYTASLYE